MHFLFDEKDFIAFQHISVCGSAYRWIVNILKIMKCNLGVARPVSLACQGPFLCSHWCQQFCFIRILAATIVH